MKIGKKTLTCLLSLLIVTSLASCSLAIEPRDNSSAEVIASLEPPQNVKAAVTDRYTSEDTASSTVSVSWDIVENAESYTIYYLKATEEFDDTRHSISNIALTQDSISLESNEIYLITVAARDRSGNMSQESETVALSTIRTIEDVSSVLSENYLQVIIRYPNILYRGEALAEPVFKIILTDDAGSQAYYADGTPVPSDITTSASSYTFNKALAPSSAYRLSVSMGFDADNDMNLSEDEIFYTFDANESFTTNVDEAPDALGSVSAEMNGKDSIRVSFTAAPVKTGLENVERRFEITRIDDSGETVVWERENPLQFENENDFYFVDEDESLRANASYTYSVMSYYYFADSNVYVRQDSSEGTVSNSAHIFSQPDNVTASLTRQGETNTYDESVSFSFPFGMSDKASISLYRRETSISLNQSNDWQLITPSGIEIDSGRENVTLKSTLSLTDEEAQSLHSYSYKVTVTDNGITSDEGISTEIVSTVPTANISLIDQFTVSERLAGKIVLDWTVNSEYEAAVSLYRSESADYSDLEELAISVSGTYTDEDITEGKTYYYALSASYHTYTENSFGSASSLEPVTQIEASKGLYSDRIELTWQGVDGADGINSYQVFFKERENDAFTQVSGSDGSSITYDNITGLYQYSFTRDAGTSSAGRTIYFAVKPVDVQGNVSQNDDALTVVAGNMLGPGAIVLDVSDAEYSDSIVASWNAVPGATQYVLRIYTSQDAEAPYSEEIVTQQNADGTYSFVFNADDAANAGGYYLSQSYWFSVYPQYNAEVSEEGTERVEGSWVLAPEGILASKAESSVLIYVSWQDVGNASGYNIYRRPAGSAGDWSFVAFTRNNSYSVADRNTSHNATNSYYEYTVSSIVAGIEGPRQTYFEDTVEDKEDLDDNIGFPLYHPEQMDVTLVNSDDEQYYLVSFKKNNFATDYIVSSTLMSSSVTVSVDDIQQVSSDENLPVEAGAAYEYNDTIYVYIVRPTIRTSVFIDVSVSCSNSLIESITDNTSEPVTTDSLIPETLRDVELINLANYILSEAISYPNEEFDGDWWRFGSVGPSDIYTFAGGTIEAAYLLSAGLTHDDIAYVRTTGFRFGNMIVNGTVYFDIYNDIGMYGGTDPIYSVISYDEGITINLPLSFGTITVKYNTVGAQNGFGSYDLTRPDGTTVTGIEASMIGVDPV